MPRISVCIANFNGIDLIDACIDSVRRQAASATVEIIVHDDASADGSVDHLRARHPDVTLIESARNVGFCIANNRMAARARGEYLLLLNNDATLCPDALQVMLAEAERLAGPAILTLPQYDAASGQLLDIGSLLDPFLNPIPNRDPARGEVGTVHGACLWLPNALWRELGGFPEWFGSVGEDLYLCCRARLAGYPVRAIGTSGYHHRVGQSFGGGKASGGRLATTYRRRALSERNKTYVIAMIYPAPAVHFLLPLHLGLLLIEGLTLSLINRDVAYWVRIYRPIFCALINERKRLMNGRRTITGRRTLSVIAFFRPFVAYPYKLRMLLRHGLPHLN